MWLGQENEVARNPPLLGYLKNLSLSGPAVPAEKGSRYTHIHPDIHTDKTNIVTIRTGH